MSNLMQEVFAALKHASEIRPQVGGFPHFAEALRLAGFTYNYWSLPSGQSIVVTEEGAVSLQGPVVAAGPVDVPVFDREALIAAIRADQAGTTTFPEFLTGAWQAGVVRYTVDFAARTVAYYGVNNEEYLEAYPAVSSVAKFADLHLSDQGSAQTESNTRSNLIAAPAPSSA